MNHLFVIVVAWIWAGLALPAWSQTPPVPPEPPGTPVPARTPKTDPNVRRHRMGEAGKSIEIDADVKAALKAHMEALEASMAQLEAQLEREDSDEIRSELDRMRQELEALREVESLNLPKVDLLDPDHPPVLWNENGKGPVILDPDSRSPLKSHGERVAYFKHLYIGHDDWIDGPAVAILGNVHVIGHVEEDVISIGGSVFVDGTVAGNVVAPFGDVHIGPNAYIEGDVVGVSVVAEDEASIGGKIEELPLFRMPWVNEGPHALLKLAATAAIAKIVFVLLFGWLALVLAPNHVVRVSERLRTKPVASFFGGVLVQILILPVFVLLLVTVVGIPLAVLALPLVVLVGTLLGFVACSRIVGEALLGRETGRPRALLFATGAMVLFAPLALASLLALGGADLGDNLFLVISLLLFVGLCLMYIVYTAGLGAAIFSRLGSRDLRPAPVTAPGGNDPFKPVRTALPQAPPAADLGSNT